MGKTTGRWTHVEHKKFVQGKFLKSYANLSKILLTECVALKIFGKDWKKVEDYVQTRSGA